jgi:hypothetical protein
MRNRGTIWHVVFVPALVPFVTNGCAADASGGAKAQPEASDEAKAQPEASDGAKAQPEASKAARCDSKASAFRDFVASHGDCTRDDECAVVGDCGPNADFEAVRAENAEMAYSLQVARCERTWDGPMFNAACSGGRCTLVQRTDTCCGCAPRDSGAGPSAESGR